MTIVNLTSGQIAVVTNGETHVSKVPLSSIDNIFGNMLNNGMSFKKASKLSDVEKTILVEFLNEGDNAFIAV
jgi:hypothetical protein